MGRNSRQRGENKIGCVIGIVLLIVGFVVVANTWPIYMDVGEFDQEVVNIAERAAGEKKYREEEFVRKLLTDRADRLQLPVTDEDITVTKRGNEINIVVNYTIVLDYGFYTYEWNKVHDVNRIIF